MRKLTCYRGLRVLVTGASSGIGRCLARRMAAEGARERTFPRWIAAGFLVQALAPGFMRRQVRLKTLDALAGHHGRSA